VDISPKGVFPVNVTRGVCTQIHSNGQSFIATYPVDLKYTLTKSSLSADADSDNNNRNVDVSRMFAPGSRLRVRVRSIDSGSNVFVDLVDHAPKHAPPSTIRQNFKTKDPSQWDTLMPANGINLTQLKIGTQFPRAKVAVLHEYGAFLDCGVYRRGKHGKVVRSDGLLHKSEMLDKYVLANDNMGLIRYGLHGASPEMAEECGVRVLNVGDEVNVRVKEVMKNSGFVRH
jgi:hypothetical protein